MQQFPPVPGSQTLVNQTPESTGYSANVMKIARQSVGKRSQNRTINDNQPSFSNNPSMIKTIDLTNMIEQNKYEDNLRNYKTNSTSSK
jgi:hypothetical protein